MVTQADKAREFLALHRPGEPLLLPNPWDLGSARLLASLGFKALATTSSGFAATLGRNDGSVSRDEALIHAAAAEVAHAGPVPFVLTARAENLPARPPRPGRHHRQAAGLPAGRRRRPLRPGPAQHRGHPPGRARGRPSGQRAGHRRRPSRARAGRSRRQPRLGGRRVRVRRPGRTGQRRRRAAGDRNLRLPGGQRQRSCRRPLGL
jgi:hypothetical protein